MNSPTHLWCCSQVFSRRWQAQERGSRLRRLPRADAGEPRGDLGVAAIERLTDLVAEVEPAEQHDIRHREAVAANELLVRHLSIKPLQPIGRDLLQPGCAFGHADDAGFESLQPLGKA